MKPKHLLTSSSFVSTGVLPRGRFLLIDARLAKYPSLPTKHPPGWYPRFTFYSKPNGLASYVPTLFSLSSFHPWNIRSPKRVLYFLGLFLRRLRERENFWDQVFYSLKDFSFCLRVSECFRLRFVAISLASAIFAVCKQVTLVSVFFSAFFANTRVCWNLHVSHGFSNSSFHAFCHECL